MAQFTFSLQAVLDHRLRLEEDAQKKLAVVQVRLEECRGAIQGLEQSRRRSAEEMYQRLSQGLPDHERLVYANYLQVVNVELQRLADVEAQILGQFAAARRVLIDAMREREVIEEVRKVEHKEYLAAENLEERKLFDELAQRSWRLAQKENLAAGLEE